MPPQTPHLPDLYSSSRLVQAVPSLQTFQSTGIMLQKREIIYLALQETPSPLKPHHSPAKKATQLPPPPPPLHQGAAASASMCARATAFNYSVQRPGHVGLCFPAGKPPTSAGQVGIKLFQIYLPLLGVSTHPAHSPPAEPRLCWQDSYLSPMYLPGIKKQGAALRLLDRCQVQSVPACYCNKELDISAGKGPQLKGVSQKLQRPPTNTNTGGKGSP